MFCSQGRWALHRLVLRASWDEMGPVLLPKLHTGTLTSVKYGGWSKSKNKQLHQPSPETLLKQRQSTEELDPTKAERQDLALHHTHEHEHTKGTAESIGVAGGDSETMSKISLACQGHQSVEERES